MAMQTSGDRLCAMSLSSQASSLEGVCGSVVVGEEADGAKASGFVKYSVVTQFDLFMSHCSTTATSEWDALCLPWHLARPARMA